MIILYNALTKWIIIPCLGMDINETMNPGHLAMGPRSLGTQAKQLTYGNLHVFYMEIIVNVPFSIAFLRRVIPC